MLISSESHNISLLNRFLSVKEVSQPKNIEKITSQAEHRQGHTAEDGELLSSL